MKLLFLDMDGVLNSHQSSRYFWRTAHNRKTFLNGFDELCPIACDNLDWLLEEIPDLAVVISSTWRMVHELPVFESKMAHKYCVPSIAGRIIGETPRLSGQRGSEILAWLTENNHLDTPYVVIDDNSDMDGVRDNFIMIDEAVGLTWHNARAIAKKFGVNLR